MPFLENLSACRSLMDTQQALGKAQEALNHKIIPFPKERKNPGFCATELLSCIIIQHHQQTQSMLIEEDKDAQLLVPTLKMSTIRPLSSIKL